MNRKTVADVISRFNESRAHLGGMAAQAADLLLAIIGEFEKAKWPDIAMLPTGMLCEILGANRTKTILRRRALVKAGVLHVKTVDSRTYYSFSPITVVPTRERFAPIFITVSEMEDSEVCPNRLHTHNRIGHTPMSESVIPPCPNRLHLYDRIGYTPDGATIPHNADLQAVAGAADGSPSRAHAHTRVRKEEEEGYIYNINNNTSSSISRAREKRQTEAAKQALKAAYLSADMKEWRDAALGPLGVTDAERVFDLFMAHVTAELAEGKLASNSMEANLKWLRRTAERKLKAGQWQEAVAPAAVAVDRRLWIARLERHADGRLYVHQYNDTEVVEVPEGTEEPPTPGARWDNGGWITY